MSTMHALHVRARRSDILTCCLMFCCATQNPIVDARLMSLRLCQAEVVVLNDTRQECCRFNQSQRRVDSAHMCSSSFLWSVAPCQACARGVL